MIRQYKRKKNLGPSRFFINDDIAVNRYDFTVINQDNLTLYCSLYEAETNYSSSSCVVYLHCNTGSRLDVKPYLPELISQGFSVCAFDFSGCGLSEGEYITLGYKEKNDIESVLAYLNSLQRYQHFFLWGRSMGAITALFYISNTKQNLIKGMILDSSFISLRRMVLEYVSNLTNLPEILIYPLIPLINRLLREKIGLEFSDFEMREQLNYLDCNTRQQVPSVLFLASKNDTVVKSAHSEELYQMYPGKHKTINYIKEKHEEDRSKKVIRDCVSFLAKTLGKIQKEDQIDRFSYNGYMGHVRGNSSERFRGNPELGGYRKEFNRSQEVLRNSVYTNNFYSFIH